MRTMRNYCAGLALLAGLTPTLLAQVPTAPPGAPAAVVAAPAPPAGPNLFDMLCPSDEKMAKCLDCVCKIPLLRGMINGVGGVAGMAGLVPGPICPDPIIDAAKGKTAADAAAGDAAAAAAAIKKIEAEAKARRAAIRYLGTVDCRYFPEATEALINGLRRDPIECVRWEAALALGNGCCCNKKTMQAMVDALSSRPTDGAPPEVSERVRAAAHAALNRCLASYEEIVPVPKGGIEGGKPEKGIERGGAVPPVTMNKNGLTQASHKKVDDMTMEEFVQHARQALADSNNGPGVAMPMNAAPSHGSRGLFQIMSNSRPGRAASSGVMTATPAHGQHVRTEPAPIAVPQTVQEPYEDPMDPLPRLMQRMKNKNESSRPVNRNRNAAPTQEMVVPVQSEPVRSQGTSQGMFPALKDRMSARQGTPRNSSAYAPVVVRETTSASQPIAQQAVAKPVVQSVAQQAPAVKQMSHVPAQDASYPANAVVLDPDPAPDEDSFAVDREQEEVRPTTKESRRFKMPWSK